MGEHGLHGELSVIHWSPQPSREPNPRPTALLGAVCHSVWVAVFLEEAGTPIYRSAAIVASPIPLLSGHSNNSQLRVTF